jgi:DNA-directed RNA polymerase sigma subunit (sigma70/sigma32)
MSDVVERLRRLAGSDLRRAGAMTIMTMLEAAAEIETLRSKLVPRAQFFLDEGRTRKIRAMRVAGETLDAIGFRFHLSKERVRQIIAKAERIERGEFRSEDYARP